MINAALLTKDQRREAMPETSRLFTEYYAEFGALPIKATENGYEFSWPRGWRDDAQS